MAHSSRGVGRSMSRPSSFTAAQDPFGGAAIKEAEVFPGTPHEGGAAGGGALQGRLSTRVKFSYALPRAVLSGVQATAGTYLVTQQYEHTRQVAYVTIVAFASLLLGSYIQAIVAHFGDGLRTTYGRRRPTLFVLAWLCAIAAFMQLHYWPSSGDPIRYYTVSYIALNIFVETAKTQLCALGTEMTARRERPERLSLFAWQAAADALGLLVASLLALSVALNDDSPSSPSVSAPTTMPLAVVLSALLLLSLLYCLATTVDQEDQPQEFNRKRFSHTRTSFVPGLRWITRNAQWKTFMVATVPLNLVAELIGIIPAVYLHRACSDGPCEAGVVQKWSLYSHVLYAAMAFLSASLLAPYLSKKYGKLEALRYFVAAGAVYSVVMVPLTLVNVPKALFLLMSVPLGLAWGGILLLKQILLSDCIDYGEILFGARQEGFYQAISHLVHLWFTFLGRAVPTATLSYVANRDGPIFDFWLAMFAGGVPLVATIFSRYWLKSFKLSRDRKDGQPGLDQNIPEKVRDNLKKRRENSAGVIDPIDGRTIIDPLAGKAMPRRNRGNSLQARLSISDQLEDVQNPEEMEEIKTENYLLYFSHGDLTLIAQKGTKGFLMVFGGQLALWCLWAGVLIWTYYELIDSFSDTGASSLGSSESWMNASDPVDTSDWCTNGVWSPALGPEKVQPALAVITLFFASVCLFEVLYHVARVRAAWWLTFKPRRRDFTMRVQMRASERQAEGGQQGLCAHMSAKMCGNAVPIAMTHLVLGLSVVLIKYFWPGAV